MTVPAVSFDDDEMTVFRIALDDPRKLKRNWPPSSAFILIFAVSLFLYPFWVVIFSEYRYGSYLFPEPLCYILDGIAAWVIDYMPSVVANILTLHLVSCVVLWLFWN